MAGEPDPEERFLETATSDMPLPGGVSDSNVCDTIKASSKAMNENKKKRGEGVEEPAVQGHMGIQIGPKKKDAEEWSKASQCPQRKKE